MADTFEAPKPIFKKARNSDPGAYLEFKGKKRAPVKDSVRHFLLGGAGGAATAAGLSGGNPWAMLVGFVAGGLAESKRKSVDDKRRAVGKPDLISTAIMWLEATLELVKAIRGSKK